MNRFQIGLFLVLASALPAASSVVVYQNDFATRTSERPVPSAQWMRAAYVKGNVTATYDAANGRDGCQFAISANNSQQDGWYKAHDGDAAGESQLYRMENAGQDNKCAMFSNSSGTVNDPAHDHRTHVFQSFQNEFRSGVLRMSFDLRAFKFTTVKNNNLFVGPLYGKYLDFWWGATLPKYAGFAGMNLLQADKQVDAVYSYSYGGNGQGAGVYDGNYKASKLINGNWYRYVVDYDLDRMTFKGKVYAMGAAQPGLDSSGQFMTDLNEYHFYADMTDETGGMAGIVIRDCGSVSSPGGTWNESQTPMVDNLRCWWRASGTGTDFTDADLFYENDFVTRRSRTLQPVPQTTAVHTPVEKTVETTFSKYFYYTAFAKDTDQMKNRLVLPASGKKTVQPVAFDGMRLLNGNSTLSFFTFNLDDNPRMIGMRLMGNTNPYGIFAQHLGETITSGKVRMAYDVRTPKSWIGSCPWIYGMLAPQEYYDSKDDDIQTTRYAFRAGFQGTANTATTKFCAIGAATETAAGADVNHWYRIVATCDLDAKTFDAAIYDVGDAPVAMDAEVAGDPVFAKTGVALKNGAIQDVSCFAFFLGGTPSMTLDGAIHVDNIRVWKQASGAADWTPLYANDFKTRTRYNVRETGCRLSELVDVPGADGWVQRANGLGPLAVKGGANPALAYDDNSDNEFTWSVQSTGSSLVRGKATFRADIKPPRVWTPGQGSSTGVSIGLGDELMYSGSRAGGDANLNFLNRYQIRFGIGPEAAGDTTKDYEVNKYRNNRPYYFNASGSRVYVKNDANAAYAFDSAHWYRFEAKVDVTAQTYDLSVYDMGTVHPEMETPTKSGALVFTCARLSFRTPLADGLGLSALTVHMAGCVKDSPWSDYDDGLAYVDNVRLAREVPGMVILVR